MIFHWSLSDSKSPQVSRTLLSILAVLTITVVCIVSIRPPNSKFYSPFNNPLVTIQNAPITIGIIVTYMFHSFSVLNQGRGTYPSFPILSVLFCGQPGQKSRQFCQISFLLIIKCLVFWPRFGDPSVRVLFTRTNAELCIYHLFVWSN